MVTTRYGDLVAQPGAFTVSGMGSQPGPVGGDGWQMVARLPQAKLPAGTGRYAIFVSGKVGNIRRSGATPQRGVLQLCLGLDTGTKSPVHKVNLSALEQLGPFEGLPFQFLMVMSSSPSISDPVFGGTFDNSSGAQWCLWGRTFWNGDPLTYAVSFDVSDVSWLWWDTDRIPAADQLCEAYVPAAPVALSTTATGIYLNINQPGSDGQKWLHFHNVAYSPRVHAGLAPHFEFGFSNTPASFSGFSAKVGTQRWGQQRGAAVAGAEAPMLQQGCFWYGVQPSGTFLPALRARDRQATAATLVHRYVYVGIRLDNLLDVLSRTETEVLNATCNLASSPLYPTVFVALERPATGIVSAPVALVHGIVATDGLQSYEAALLTNTFDVLDDLDSCSQSDALRQEAVSCMAFATRGLSATLPAIQYRATFVGGLNAPPRSLPVRDLSIVQFNLVRDPDFIPAQPGSPGNPVALSVDRESADPGSLNPPPIAPDAELPEDATREDARIEGATGYARTWPLFMKVRRQFGLDWSRLSEANGATVYAFLKANVAFRYTPPRGAAIAFVQLDPPELVQVSGQVYAVRARGAELIWTGP